MITNELDSASSGELSSSRRSQRKKLKSSSESNESSNLLPLRTFHLHSSTSLQIVVTRTFLSMLDTISKTLQITDEKSSSTAGDVGENIAAIGGPAPSSDPATATSGVSDEYSAYEQEEEMLFEKLKNRLVHDHEHEHESSPDHVERSSPAKDHYSDEKTSDNNQQQQGEENASFNFLIRNELGADVYLEALNGFHVKKIN